MRGNTMGFWVLVALIWITALAFFGFLRPARVKECRKYAESFYNRQMDEACEYITGKKRCYLSVYAPKLEEDYLLTFFNSLEECDKGLWP